MGNFGVYIDNRYRQLSCNGMSSPSPVGDVESGSDRGNDPSDLVALKISLLGDCQIGKTSFLVGEGYIFLCFPGNQTGESCSNSHFCVSFIAEKVRGERKRAGRNSDGRAAPDGQDTKRQRGANRL